MLLKDGRCKTLVSQADKSGNTPLHVAAGSGNTRIVKVKTFSMIINYTYYRVSEIN